MILNIEELKNLIKDVLVRAGVRKAALFGSVARNDVTDESDIDILIEFEGNKTLLDLVDLKIELEDRLKRKVDVLTFNSIHPLLRDSILNNQIVIL